MDNCRFVSPVGIREKRENRLLKQHGVTRVVVFHGGRQDPTCPEGFAVLLKEVWVVVGQLTRCEKAADTANPPGLHKADPVINLGLLDRVGTVARALCAIDQISRLSGGKPETVHLDLLRASLANGWRLSGARAVFRAMRRAYGVRWSRWLALRQAWQAGLGGQGPPCV